MDQTQQKKALSSPRRFVALGYGVIFICLGSVGAWSATAKIDSAVVASGTISLEGNRKSIQHLEGGIVDEIMVAEGDVVSENDILVRLSDVQARSNVEVVAQRLGAARAIEARLVAESDFAAEITFPQDLLDSQLQEVQATVADQINLFNDRKSIRESQREILASRIVQTRRQIDGLDIQQTAFDRRLTILTAQLDRLSDGQEQGVVQANFVTTRQDELIEVEVARGSIITEMATAENQINEIELQRLQLEQEYRERANTELKDVRAEISELNERFVVAQDVLERTEIRSPVNGTVQNIQIYTSGGVIRPGSDLMDVVPNDEPLIVNAQVQPIDIDNVEPGLLTEVRFVAFNTRLTPLLFGTVDTVSSDIIVPDTPNAVPHFLARIRVDESHVPENIRSRVTPGMPVDVVVSTGERTVLDYLIAPLADAIRKSFREE